MFFVGVVFSPKTKFLSALKPYWILFQPTTAIQISFTVLTPFFSQYQWQCTEIRNKMSDRMCYSRLLVKSFPYLGFLWDLGLVLCVPAPFQCHRITKIWETSGWKGYLCHRVGGIHIALPVGTVQKSTSRLSLHLDPFITQEVTKEALDPLFPEPVPLGALRTEVWAGDTHTAPCILLEEWRSR